MFGKRRIAALAAVVALAMLAGALGGALATAALTHVAGDDAAIPGNHALEATVARIDADILALKAGVEHTSKLGMSQFNKTSDRLDKLEKAQAEPAAKIAKLSEAVDKLRAAPAALRRRRRTRRRQRTSPARLRRRQRRQRQRRPRSKSEGCRRWTAGCCVTSPVAAPDRRPAGHLRSVCRRFRAGPRPGRCHPPPGRPLGGRDQQGPDRRAVSHDPAKRGLVRRSWASRFTAT